MPETSAETNAYDLVPYESQAFQETHPDSIATVAVLCGFDPPDVAHARVLELGCAGGGNLIPMGAAAPGGRFVGIDLSKRQIDDGRAVVEKLGLENVDLRTMSITDIDADFGRFDYIVCHGVYSWVPEPVQEAILRVCERNLAPNGLAFLSYNTLPGWFSRTMARDLMLYASEAAADPLEGAKRSREAVATMAAVTPRVLDQTTAGIWAELHESIRKQADFYILHEYLEETNLPIYFHKFVDRIERHGLEYVGDSRFRSTAAYQPGELRTYLDRFAKDGVRREQFYDFLRNRTFRRSIVRRADGTRPDVKPWERLGTLRLSACSGPVSPVPELFTSAVEAFRSTDGKDTLSTGDPVAKTALAVLASRWPRTMPFAELREAVYERLANPPVPNPAPVDRSPGTLERMLFDAFMGGIVELHVFEPEYCLEPGPRPEGFGPARAMAERGSRVTSARHRAIDLTEFERLVIRQLDGRRDRGEVVDRLVAAAVDRSFPLNQNGRSITDAILARPIMARSLDPCLRRLAGSALLIA